MVTNGTAVAGATDEVVELVQNGDILYFDWEVDVLNWFQGFHNPILDKINFYVTNLGKAGIFWVLLTMVLLLVLGNKQYKASGKTGLRSFIFQHEKQIAWASFWSLVLSVFIVNIVLKNVTMRCRPAWILDPANAMLVSQSDYSFPSGHTSASFSSAVAIYQYNKKWGTAALVLAACISISRLYLFIHWPTDVIVSVFIGIFDGIMGTLIAKTIAKKFA